MAKRRVLLDCFAGWEEEEEEGAEEEEEEGTEGKEGS